MSFTTDAMPENRRLVSDARTLRALAHPLRVSLLNHLMSFGAQTASECAAAIGSTASNCSYHLRSLARAGFVESLESPDGRERPWRSTVTGLEFRPSGPEDAAANAIELTLAEAQIDDGLRLRKKALAERDTVPAEWREAAADSVYALRMTAGELAELGRKLDALIRPYIGLTRTDVPDGSEVVHLEIDAFLHPDRSR